AGEATRPCHRPSCKPASSRRRVLERPRAPSAGLNGARCGRRLPRLASRSASMPEARMASYQTIKDWPEEDRPREKLLARGAQSLSETELLAIILRNGNASTGESAIDHARLLL